MNKLEKMHTLFGTTEGQKCKDCNHFLRYKYHDRGVSKCEIYGDTRSESSDWVGKYNACGLWNEPYKGDVSIIRLRFSGEEKQIDGQMSLFEGRE